MRKVYLFFLLFVAMCSARAQYMTDSFSFGGVMRQYLLYVPPSYDGSQAVPFVLALHGLGDDMNNFAGVRFDQVADTANFILAIPQALVDNQLTGSTAWNSGAGAFGITLNPGVDDVGFLNALMDTVSAYYNIDQTRMYSTGFSMGGFMTNRLGCELNNRIAAIASVSGTIGNGISCHPSRVVPACHFHGTADQTVAYTGNNYGNDAEALVEYWRSHDQCDSAAVVDTIAHTTANALRIIHYTYPNGAYNSDVEFYKVLGGQHQWLGPSGYDINYAVEIWNFFRKYKWEPQAPNSIAEQEKLHVRVYPNPASGAIRINADGFGPAAVVTLTDMAGRKVYSGLCTGETIVDTANFAKGIYVVEVSEGSSRSVCRLAVID
ncbi:MAG: T9SS type A sorting domain-containing protein [Bacteroidetes bacterium]|nr:T9SS type A sorting domain-containing protein [Bacteroidota bacterium]